jgi:hypothetical protein
MNIILPFLVIRILTFLLSAVLLFMQGRILWIKRGKHNGMRPYRILLFLFTLAFVVDNAIISGADVAAYFFNIGHGTSMDYLVYVRLVSRLIEVGTISYFYKLIYTIQKIHHDDKDTK